MYNLSMRCDPCGATQEIKMSYVVFKYQDGKKLYLSTQGRWIKSAANAAAYSREKAAEVAAQHGACKRPIKFRV